MAEQRDTELRGQIPRSLLVRIDALAIVDGVGTRMDWVIRVLEAEAERRVHAATLLLRLGNGNPHDSAPPGGSAD
jgi:hypothetical protein